MDRGAATELFLKQLEAGDNLAGLSLGHKDFAPLKAFLRKEALRFEAQSLARTYGVFNADNRIKAFITLVCGEVAIKDGVAPPIDEPLYRYRQYPAIKIARLAVDKSLQRCGAGIGRELVKLALGIAKGVICPAVGCRFVMVESKSASIRFYERCGFTLLGSPDNRDREAPILYVDLNKLT